MRFNVALKHVNHTIYNLNTDIAIFKNSKILGICLSYSLILKLLICSLPEQAPLLQFLDCVSLPLQGLPPFRCLCFTVLLRLWNPSPHVVLHSVHAPNLSHSQSTANENEI